jgi:hypothetical protein
VFFCFAFNCCQGCPWFIMYEQCLACCISPNVTKALPRNCPEVRKLSTGIVFQTALP